MSDDERLPYRPFGWEMVFAWCSSDVARFGGDEDAGEGEPGTAAAGPGRRVRHVPRRRRWRRPRR